MFPTRRSVLFGGAAAVGLTAVGLPALAATGTPRLAFPFTLGIASGDPSADGVVLWTRLALDPLAPDGHGGMPNRVVPVQWQVSTDERFTRVVRAGVEFARPETAHSVHVELAGLRAGTEYFYRFRVDGHLSVTGRTRTAPAAGALGQGLTMCFASCSHYGEGFFTAYRRLAEDQPDLVLHLGDYQYEYAAKAADVRVVAGPETRALADYRLRHAQYKSDADLQFAHQVAPWLVVFDDHEIENNWASDTPEAPDPAFPARKAAAFQAYYENMPLRRVSRPRGAEMQLFRRVRWGSLATFHMLDTRQYRDDQACGDGTKVDCGERLEPTRTITGAEQERWLLDGLRTSRARWDVLGQQVFFAQRDLTAGERQGFSMDSWDGYKASRDKVASALGGTRNGVVLTGDVHRHWAGEVKESYDRPDSRGVATELVTTSITSTGDGDESTSATVLAENPHLKFFKNRRGYVRTKFSAGELRADFRTLPYVRTAGAPVETAASFVVEDRVPTLNRV
ncbi:alkaline phosphatase D family protein [Actinokineospora spheciospongiae]|uniref:alkaline phosphatase D family protein n=1 Tax=Actinokineospora spheciospongiae TaxID=909613 RepID=UPI000D70CA47|nr:alkaline phosphatase D family protein [Actinokineospora spheciospongiae]PWW64369.1 alkaline phosphatase D [Actinokineospora spheciospongiae]